MNLIQIQERLKGLPPGPQTLHLLQAYANGMNTEVPPYLALGEIQRRNKAEQDQAQAQAEQPSGTVKDQIEQQSGLAALQGMGMGMGMGMPQGQQPMPQGPGGPPMPMPAPQGAPQGAPQPQATGIANAAAQPGGMQPGVLKMAGGGIVAFAEGGDSEDEDEDEDGGEEPGAGYGGAPEGDESEEDRHDRYSRFAGDEDSGTAAQSFPVDIDRLKRMGVTPIVPPEVAQAVAQGPEEPAAGLGALHSVVERQVPQGAAQPPIPQRPQGPPAGATSIPPRVAAALEGIEAQLPSAGGTPPGPPQGLPALVNRPAGPPQGPPQANRPTAQQLAELQAIAAQRRANAPAPPAMASRESLAQQNPAMYGVLNKPVGQDYLAGLQAIAAKQGTQDEAARKQLEANKRMDFFRSMIAAGEATRGQRGIGALAAGFGRSMIPALEKRGEEAADIESGATKREALLEKAKFEIEGLQRAQASGDLKAINAEKLKLFKTAVDAYASGNTLLGREIAALAGIREKEIAAAASEKSAQIRATAKKQGGGAEKITDQERSVADYYAARIARGEKPGPETKAKARDDHARGRAVGPLEGVSQRSAADIAKRLKDEEIIKFAELEKLTPEQKEQWRKKRRDEMIAEDEAARRKLQESPGPAPSPGPGATPATRLKFDAQGKLQQ